MKRVLQIAGLAMTIGMITGLSTGIAVAGDIKVSEAERTSLSLTIYSNGSAMVRDLRTFAINEGPSDLLFSGVASEADGTSFHIVDGGNLQIHEKTLLPITMAPANILRRSIGKRIEVINENGEIVQEGQLQTAGSPALIKTDEGGLMMIRPENLVFKEMPLGLRAEPVFRARVDAAKNHVGELDLSYLTEGLGWTSNYRFIVNQDFTKGQLLAWATLINQTDMDFPGAKLQLVAGSINRQESPQLQRRDMVMETAMMSASSEPMSAQAPRESFAGYHLYRIQKPVDLIAGQMTQVSLIDTFDVDVSRKLIHRRMPHFYGRQGRIADTVVHPDVVLKFDNSQQPLPAGQISVFRQDENYIEQLIGEDRLPDTPAGEIVKITTGKAFDVSIRHHREDLIKKGLPRNSFEEIYSVSIVNGGSEDTTVVIAEPFPGDWEIRQESTPHHRVRGEAHWKINVPAKGKAGLTYRVRVQF